MKQLEQVVMLEISAANEFGLMTRQELDIPAAMHAVQGPSGGTIPDERNSSYVSTYFATTKFFCLRERCLKTDSFHS